jgi:hypothetical protein
MCQTNLLPGLTNEHVEMFVEKNDLKILKSGKVISFSELSFATISILNEAIAYDKEVRIALHDLHPNSQIKRTEQFAKCRFGGLDFKADIENGELQDGEYWPCPNRGNCPHEGVLCKLPIVNGERLSDQDIKLIQESTTDKTNEVIAEELGMPMGSYHKSKRKLHKKLGNIQTKQALTKIALQWNII